jgi:hypothetical protein
MQLHGFHESPHSEQVGQRPPQHAPGFGRGGRLWGRPKGLAARAAARREGPGSPQCPPGTRAPAGGQGKGGPRRGVMRRYHPDTTVFQSLPARRRKEGEKSGAGVCACSGPRGPLAPHAAAPPFRGGRISKGHAYGAGKGGPRAHGRPHHRDAAVKLGHKGAGAREEAFADGRVVCVLCLCAHARGVCAAEGAFAKGIHIA